MPRETLEARFWAKVDKRGPDECWEWTAHKQANGYGTIGIGDKSHRAHRISYQLHKGEIPEGLCICHTCDNPGCVNPDHLWAGTQKENRQDCARKGRSPAGRGERHRSAKLTTADVIEIRRAYAAGECGSRKLGKRFGIAPGNILCIVQRTKWKHVE
jgi:hypothetical protein